MEKPRFPHLKKHELAYLLQRRSEVVRRIDTDARPPKISLQEEREEGPLGAEYRDAKRAAAEGYARYRGLDQARGRAESALCDRVRKANERHAVRVSRELSCLRGFDDALVSRDVESALAELKKVETALKRRKR